MKKWFWMFLLVIICLGCAKDITGPEQAPDIEWTKTFGGVADERGYSVQQTSDGGYIVAGSTGRDIYLLKTTASGNKIWEKTFDLNATNIGRSVQQTTDGGYIVAGWTESYLHTGDVCLMKTNSSGDTEWTKTYGDTFCQRGYSVQQTSDGGYVVVGSTGPTETKCNVYLIKTNGSGNTLWTRTFGDTLYQRRGYSVQQTTDGGYIISGYPQLIKTNPSGDTLWTKEISNLGTADQVQQTTDGGYIITGTDYNDIFLLKANSSGGIQWTKDFPSLDYWAGGYSVQQTTDGGYIIAGYTELYGTDEDDVYLIKTNSSGDTLWTKTFGGVADERGYSVQQTSDGGYIVAGYTESYGAGGSDVYLIKLKP